MKKSLVVMITFLLMLSALTGCSCQKKGNENVNVDENGNTLNEDGVPVNENGEPLSEIEQQVKNGTEEEQGMFTVTDVKIEEVGAESVVSGKVTNNSPIDTSVRVNLMMTDSESGRLFGIVDIDVEDVKSGETKDFSISMIGDYSEVNNFEVRVSGI